MHLPPAPDPRELLPPLLACLPTAFIASRPPPALLPLLAPLLRQRATYLPSDAPVRGEGWLPLLSWDAERAAKLPAVVEGMQLEPHPVSGEVEIDEVGSAKYTRLDEETLHARLEVEQFDLLPIYVWCESDDGSTGPGWKLSELRSIEDIDDRMEWFDTLSEANDAAYKRPAAQSQPSGGNGQLHPTSMQQKPEDDDDDYWASYDRTPGRTPAQKNSPAPSTIAAAAASSTNRQRSSSEAEYYARYGAEVQPAMDAHDPDEEHPEIGESTLNGGALPPPQQHPQLQQQEGRPVSRPNGGSMFPADTTQQTDPMDVEAPRPISPTSSQGSSSVERLESRAAEMSDADGPGLDRAQMAVKQHISTDVKSLFRLARNSGMERRDFERIIRTELDCLSLLEQDE